MSASDHFGVYDHRTCAISARVGTLVPARLITAGESVRMMCLGSRSAVLAARIVIAAVAACVGFSLWIDRWRSMETVVVVRLLHLVGVHSPQNVGDQIIAVDGLGSGFAVYISQSCSSLGLVAGFGAFSAIVARGNPRRRWLAFAMGSGLVVAGNLMRVAVTVFVGVRSGPGSIQSFHDGVANWFAVALVLGACGLFAWNLPRDRDRPQRPRSDDDTGIPTRCSPAVGWGETVDVDAATFEDPRGDRVRVPHLTGMELVSAPHRRGHRRHKFENPLCIGELDS